MKILFKKFLRSFRVNEFGFTLIELLVVVAILGVLAAVAVPNVSNFLGSGKIQAVKANEAALQTAADAYSVEHNGDFPTNLGDLYPNYLREWPTLGNYTITDGKVYGTE
jgi:prepilin-type N-terminal cleavage/methylation domain-containing protein